MLPVHIERAGDGKKYRKAKKYTAQNDGEVMKKEAILHYLASIKPKYQKEGFLIKALFGSYSREEADEKSDIDILVEATPEFASRYGFGAIARIKQIREELMNALGVTVDLADSSGMGRTGKRFIIDRAIYV